MFQINHTRPHEARRQGSPGDQGQAGVCRYAPAFGPRGWARDAPDPGRDQRSADPGSRQENRARVSGPKERTMIDHKIGRREKWLAAREKLLEREKQHTRLGDELARPRRALPWGRGGKGYRFETHDGERA